MKNACDSALLAASLGNDLPRFVQIGNIRLQVVDLTPRRVHPPDLPQAFGWQWLASGQKDANAALLLFGLLLKVLAEQQTESTCAAN